MVSRLGHFIPILQRVTERARHVISKLGFKGSESQQYKMGSPEAYL